MLVAVVGEAAAAAAGAVAAAGLVVVNEGEAIGRRGM